MIGPLSAAPLSPPEIKNLLGQIREKRDAAPYLQADFREEKIIRLMNKPIVTSGKVWFQAPQKFLARSDGKLTQHDGQRWPAALDLLSKIQNRLSIILWVTHSPLDAVFMAALNTALNLENVESTFHITGEQAGAGL